MKRIIILLAATCCLNACSKASTENEIKGILQCAMAAKLVGQEQRINKISDHANYVAAKGGYDLSVVEAQKMHADIKAKWNLKSMSRQDQDKLLVDVYNSKTCAELHGGRSITVADVPPDA